MPIENDGVMIILSSPSGAGKTTLVNLLSKKIILKFQYLTLPDNQDRMKFLTKIIILLMKLNLKD